MPAHSKMDVYIIKRLVITPPVKIAYLYYIGRENMENYQYMHVIHWLYWLKNLPQNLLYETVEKVQESVEGKMDGRLAMQYIYALYLYTLFYACIMYIYNRNE